MRKYQKRLCWLLICSMVAGLLAMPVLAEVDHPYDDEPADTGTTTASTTFPDVPANAPYAEAVRTLNELGVITGDDRGNFNPNKTITRAEAVTIICRMLGVADEAKGMAADSFSDVSNGHWASGYIAKAVELGIVGGYGNGKFGPSDPVTYEQMVKMLVCAWGYNDEARERGGYPNGYIAIASDLELLTNMQNISNRAAPRADVALLASRILQAPIGQVGDADK